jgi:hypothetical protein
MSSTELIQLSKLNIFIEHYKEHKEFNDELNLMSFIKMHYSQDSAHDSKDMKLPFKSDIPSAFSIAICNEPTPFSISFEPQKYFIKKDFIFYETVYHNNGYLSAIWQPPKNIV